MGFFLYLSLWTQHGDRQALSLSHTAGGRGFSHSTVLVPTGPSFQGPANDWTHSR